MLCSCSRLTASQSASTAPVCSSCPRTNATSCLSNALSFWSQRRDSQRQSETRTHRAAQRKSAAISDHPRPSEAVTCNQRPSEAIRGNQKQSEAIRGHQRQSDAIIRGNQRQSEVIRGNQRPSSEAIRGNRMQSEAISMPSGFVTLAEARHSQIGARARRRPPWAPRHAARRVRCT
jgi:hypothetical protein